MEVEKMRLSVKQCNTAVNPAGIRAVAPIITSHPCG